jgi:hypothetical protein
MSHSAIRMRNVASEAVSSASEQSTKTLSSLPFRRCEHRAALGTEPGSVTQLSLALAAAAAGCDDGRGGDHRRGDKRNAGSGGFGWGVRHNRQLRCGCLLAPHSCPAAPSAQRPARQAHRAATRSGGARLGRAVLDVVTGGSYGMRGPYDPRLFADPTVQSHYSGLRPIIAG